MSMSDHPAAWDAGRPRAGQFFKLIAWPLFVAMGFGLVIATFVHGRTGLPPGLGWSITVALGAVGVAGAYVFLGLAMSLVGRLRLADALGRGTQPLIPLALMWPLLVTIYASDAFNHRVANEQGPAWIWGAAVAASLFWAIYAVAHTADGGGGGGPARRVLEFVRDSSAGPLKLLVVQFVIFRAMVLIAFTPLGFFERGSDYGAFEQRARLGAEGLLPGLDYWLEYPPLFPWVSATARLIAESFGGGYVNFDISLAAILLLFETGNLIFIYLIAKRAFGEEMALRIAISYSVLFLPIYAWRRTFEAMPLFFALSGLYFLIQGRRTTAAASLAIGFMTKVFPAVLALTLLRSSGGLLRSWRSLFAFGATALVIGLPLLAAGPTFFIASYRNMLARPPWESLWAVLGGYSSFGWVHRYRLDPDTATEFAQGQPLSRAVNLLLILLLVVVFVYMITKSGELESPTAQIRFTTVSLLAFAIYLKGWSPQFMVWILPLVLLSYPGGRGLVIALGLSVLSLLENPGYFVLWSDSPWVLWIIVGARNLAFAVMGVHLFRLVLAERRIDRTDAAEAVDDNG